MRDESKRTAEFQKLNVTVQQCFRFVRSSLGVIVKLYDKTRRIEAGVLLDCYRLSNSAVADTTLNLIQSMGKSWNKHCNIFPCRLFTTRQINNQRIAANPCLPP